MLPFNMGAGGTSGVDTGDIGHSLRFRSGASASLTKTYGTAGNRDAWTLHMACKRANLAAAMQLFGVYSNNQNVDNIGFAASDALEWTIVVANSTVGQLTTSRLFRDPTAHIFLTFSYDSLNATANNRMRIYVSGTEETSFTTRTNPGSGQDSWVNSTASSAIGQQGDNTEYFGGYLSRICFVDGQALTPSSFGYLNTEINEWVTKSQSAVKAVVDAGGTNSFMLDFDNGTSLTTLGYDKSSKGNNWTLNNFSLTAGTSYDWMLDVPGNSRCTGNPLNTMLSSAMAEGGLKIGTATATLAYLQACTQAMTTGKWYWEAVVTGYAAGSGAIGVFKSSASLDAASAGGYANTNWYGYCNDGKKMNGASQVAYGATYNATAPDVVACAFDADAGTVEFFKNGVSQGVAFTGVTGGAYPAFMTYNGNFFVLCTGQAPLHASATYDSASGGYFRYAPPSGYKALCQRNMPDPAILNPKNGFVSVLATEDNIYSTLASARSGWADYVDILKNRAASESWAWQFSHDSSNEYAVSASSLVRQTKRTQSGSNNWVGYSIRIGATYGTAAGSVSHTNGSATTITHNVGKSARQLILLVNRAGGAAVPVYHPDLTSGELLDLCTTAADAASTSITSVGTNSFQIGSATATGTYDYLVCSEISGFFDLGKWTGNAAADGAYYDAGHKPKMLYAKALSTTDDHRVYDELRPGYNVQGGVVLANTNGIETTAAEMDLTAFGMKARITTTPNAAQTYVTASWASSSGKYSLGR